MKIDCLLHRIARNQNPAESAELLQGRVVQVQRNADAAALRLRNHGVQKIRKPVPERLLRNRQRRIDFRVFQTKCRCQRATAFGVDGRGPQPANFRHEVHADGRKAVFCQQRYHLKNLFDRCVAQSICALDVIVDAVGHRLDDKRAKPFCLKSLGNRTDVRRVRHIKSLVLRQRPLQTAVCCVLRRCRHSVPSAPAA